MIDRVAAMVAAITDFTRGTDSVGLGAASYAGLFDQGVMRAGILATGSAATTTQQRLFYNTANGGLYFDSDGSGTAAAVQIATVVNLAKPTPLAASDFTLVMGG